jgi:Secretion system C-terminal sorting domain
MIIRMNRYLLILCCITLSFSVKADSLVNTSSGSWYDASIWNLGRIPNTYDNVTIAAGTTVTVFGPYTDCDLLTINGFLDVGATNLTIGGRDLQIDVRAVRNSYCIVNGRLRINGDWNTQFKVYGYVKFNTGSIFDMSAGQMMIDGCAFTEALSITADHALLDVTDAAAVNSTGGVINMFNAHYHPTGLVIKGAKHFYSVSFGNNLTLPNFAQRHTSDFLISETDKPTFSSIRLAYLPNPNRQNRVVLNNVSITGNLDMSSGLLVGTGRFKVGGNLLIAADGRIETDIECNGTWQQNINSYLSGNTSAVIKGNLYINIPHLVQTSLNLDIQNGTIQMIQGKLDASNKTISVTSAPVGGSASSYVNTANGGVLVVKNVSGATNFPVGTNDSYLPVILTASSGDFSVAARPLSIGVNSGTFGINSQWDINRLAGTATAEIKVQWNTSNETSDFTTYRQNARLHHYNGSSWQPLGNIGTIFANNAYSKTTQNVGAFSTFSVMTQVATAIPVTLKNFSAKLAKNDTFLTWQTATELNNKGFDIEKSVDGLSFASLGFVKGAGNIFETKSYEFLDNNFSTTSYYRLKQTDFDGKFVYSPTVALQFKSAKNGYKIYPNPLTTESVLTIETLETTQNGTKVAIYDVKGQLMFQTTGVKDSLKIPVNNWAQGLYMVHLTNGVTTTVEKFMKN